MFDPIKSSAQIKKEFISYIKTRFDFVDPSINAKFSEALERDIAKGPYLEINGVFKTGRSMRSLMEEGVLSPLWDGLERSDKGRLSLPLDRKLYLHQVRAIEKIVSGRNAIVSTGTGSGKTNCFLVPIVDSLLREAEKGTLGPGVRAILIYPMNALANDQIKNIRNLLLDYPSITFGVYNGDTEYDELAARKSYEANHADEALERLREPLPNELISRERMRECPPHLLLTNYVMLEHLLLRPGDDVLFTQSNLRFIVLDEAHVYSGARGIETSYLMRRLLARISPQSKTQFILTSATLGKGPESNEEIIRFAQNISGLPFDESDIVRGDREEIIDDNAAEPLNHEFIRKLADESLSTKSVLDEYGVAYEPALSERELIYDVIASSRDFRRLRDIGIHSRCLPFREIAERLGMDSDTAVAFISLCARASKNGKGLIDVRYHFWVKALDGVFVSPLTQDVYLDRVDRDGEGNACFEVAICLGCGHHAYVGQIKRDYDDGRSYFKPLGTYDFDKSLYLVDAKDFDAAQEEAPRKVRRYILCHRCGAIEEKKPGSTPIHLCDHRDFHHEMVEVKPKERVDPRDQPKHACPRCGADLNRFILGNDAATEVLATSLYEEIPGHRYEEISGGDEDASAEDDLFASLLSPASKTKKREVGSARQFLVFSDSRQEAAKFAPNLSDMYREFLRRRGVCHVAKEIGQAPLLDFVESLAALFDRTRVFREYDDDNQSLTRESRKQAWVAMLNEMSRASSANSLVSLGKIRFHFAPNENCADVLAKGLGKSKNEVIDFLDALIFEIVKMGAIEAPDYVDLNDEDREYIFYSPSSQRVIADVQSPNGAKKPYLHPWAPKAKENERGYYSSTRFDMASVFLEGCYDDPAEFLNNYFKFLCGKGFLSDKGHCEYALKASDFVVQTPRCEEAKWYRCSRCGKFFQYSVKGSCPTRGCDGRLSLVDPHSLSAGDHYAELYEKDGFEPLFIKEHTGQLTRSHGLRYQTDFIKKKINALSCSTTFEMGVDIGDLEMVFLRNIPPLPSNYAQRAGRAGRSAEAAAYCLSFAKLGSHDFTFFASPEKMISGSIEPPIFKLENERIAHRHIYAVALAWFFKINPDYFDENKSRPFLESGGFEEFVRWLGTKPDDLKGLLERSIPGGADFHRALGLSDYSWVRDFVGPNGCLTTIVESHRKTLEEYKQSMEEASKGREFLAANSYKRGLDLLRQSGLIEFLSRGNVLPRYGFPVDTVELETPDKEGGLSLARDLSIAIGDYAPSSEVIADGKMYTSRYIKKAWSVGSDKLGHYDFHHGYVAKCKRCEQINFSEAPVNREKACISCGETIESDEFVECIEPREGFVSDGESKPVKRNRTLKSHSTRIAYIGDIERWKTNIRPMEMGGAKIEVTSTANDSFLYLSEDWFYVCKSCGYGVSAREVGKDSNYGNSKSIEKEHHPSRKSRVKCDSKVLSRERLCHVVKSDAAIIDFKDADVSSEERMLSVLYAILRAASSVLSADPSDIGGCLFKKDGRFLVVVMDTAPGGIGYARKLSDEDILEKVLRVAAENMLSCKCGSSCYACLRDYGNQPYHDKLDRKLAFEFLSRFL